MSLFFFFNDTATTEIYTLSLHDALPILSPRRGGRVSHRRRQRRRDHAVTEPESSRIGQPRRRGTRARRSDQPRRRSEEHTSELQSPCNLVCRLLLEKKKQTPKSLHTQLN